MGGGAGGRQAGGTCVVQWLGSVAAHCWAAGSSRCRAKCGWAEDSGTGGRDAWAGPGSARERTHHLCSSPCTPGAAPCPKACSMKKKKEEWETTAMCCSGRDISHCERVHKWRAVCERRHSGRRHRWAGRVGAAQQWAGVVGSQGGMEGKEGERRRFYTPRHTSGAAPAWPAPPGCPRRCPASTSAALHARRRPGAVQGGPSGTAGG